LPRADVVVLTYTSDEGKALADVLTPGRFQQDWNAYTNGYEALLPDIRAGAPARQSGKLGAYWMTAVGGKSVLVFKSNLHLHQDYIVRDGHPTMPIRTLFQQIIQQCQPAYFFCIGTAGGTFPNKPLGSVAMSRAVKWDCAKDFAHEPFAHDPPYTSNWAPSLAQKSAALSLMGAFTRNLEIPPSGSYGHCPCSALQPGEGSPPAATFMIDGQDGVPAFMPVLTTDYFEFGTDQNDLYQQGMAVEMDDAVLGLVCSTLASPPKWASIRNYSDPAINGALPMQQQETCASEIYMKYGYWTSVLGAIGTWSIIAGL
jgi:nucleoside phosphorylase